MPFIASTKSFGFIPRTKISQIVAVLYSKFLTLFVYWLDFIDNVEKERRNYWYYRFELGYST